VPYADLSDFFYVWLRRTVGHLYPEHFRTPLTPKGQEAVQNPVRHGGDNEKAKRFFEEMMGEAFREMHRVLGS
jgi:putative DNA methylase